MGVDEQHRRSEEAERRTDSALRFERGSRPRRLQGVLGNAAVPNEIPLNEDAEMQHAEMTGVEQDVGG